MAPSSSGHDKHFCDVQKRPDARKGGPSDLLAIAQEWRGSRHRLSVGQACRLADQ